MTTLYKNVDGVNVELTPAEYDEYYARQAEWESNALVRLKDELQALTELTIDAVAKYKSYNNAVSCASYATSTNVAWKEEADAFVAYRDSVYEYAIDYMNRAESGAIANPSKEDYMSNFPVMVWPQ
jgi:hypothetical protein